MRRLLHGDVALQLTYDRIQLVQIQVLKASVDT